MSDGYFSYRRLGIYWHEIFFKLGFFSPITTGILLLIIPDFSFAICFKELPKNLDSTDGLAAAVCHFYNQGRPDNSKTYTGWKAFISQNPKKVKSG